MYFSKFNVISHIAHSSKYFLINPLYKQADILDENEYTQFLDSICFDDSLKQKGYITTKEKETSSYENAYKAFIKSRTESETQIFFVPTYACNFKCSYCYQDEYEIEQSSCSSEIIDSFFTFINTNITGKKYITIFGGEPLLSGNSHRADISHLLSRAKEHSIEIAIVTNGYNLENYIDILWGEPIREIQVTLDGPAHIHNTRRTLKNGASTFERIVTGINIALENKIPINLRVVLDKDNIHSLNELAQFAINSGWTDNPLFKTQLGRNYELHHCQKNNNRLYDRIELYKELYAEIIKHPEISKFHKPAFSISRFLFENGSMPEPLFDSCPACKSEWAFDYTGNIYSCTATVGKADEVIGTYYPQSSLNNDVINQWKNRDVTTISDCQECELSLMCGGGCGSLAKNKTGKINSPDCRPIKELLELGISLYYEKGV